MRPNPSTDSRSQQSQILAVLISARGGWVPAPELARIALQFQTRVKEIRDKLGLKIENRIQRVGRKQFSSYRLVSSSSTPHHVALKHSQGSIERERGIGAPSSHQRKSNANQAFAESLFDLTLPPEYPD